MIVGQEKLCRMIDNSTLDTFPRSLMLVGLEGSGKHLLCNYIATKFNLPMNDITESLDLDTITDIYQKVEPSIYTILINKISVQKENLILKFLEEPLKNAYIILLAETEIGILQTVLNRCQIWQLQHYSKEVLSTFITNGDTSILDVAQTPGQVISLSGHPFQEMIVLADKMLNRIKKVTIPTAIGISEKMAHKNEKDKFNVKIFVDILLNRISKMWAETSDASLVEVYRLTSELKRDMSINNVDVKSLFEKYLLDLRFAMRGSIL